MKQLVEQVEQWGADKGILTKATPSTQWDKLVEEVNELALGIETHDHDEIVDAIGDCTVVLILMSKLCGTDIEFCLQSAYDVISKRTGKMRDGVFVKD